MEDYGKLLGDNASGMAIPDFFPGQAGITAEATNLKMERAKTKITAERIRSSSDD
ncbi:MAG: hypothetical protein QF541_18025 [Lentisphaeria bacterium]|nr:hypothetical protein [Lentisphaeria bacterium]